MKSSFNLFALTAVVVCTAISPGSVAAAQRPNILWITLEDISRDLGCYGDQYALSPNIDKLASSGVLFTHAWSNAGMCAPARATLITGMYPPSSGAQNMRSEVRLPEFIRAFPEYLRTAGYHTSNHVKTDYNWRAPEETWTQQDNDWKQLGWRQRKPNQPFFTVINITDTHSSQIYWRGEKRYQQRVEKLGPKRLHDPADAPVPPYYPDTPEVRQDLARYYDNITYADLLVGEILQQLADDGLADDTIVFFFSDHGRGMPRSKGWCFQVSLRVPLVIRFGKNFAHLAPQPAGKQENRLVSFVDFAPTVLSLAGVEIPKHMQGRAFLGEQAAPPRTYAFAFRDRMDERIDLIRAVWDGRYKYIRNYYPHLPWFHHQTRDYPHTQPTYETWHRLANDGQLKGDSAIYMARTRPRKMLFDTEADPHELRNLAELPEHAETLGRLRAALVAWQDDIIDLGFMPESEWFEQFEDQGDLTPRYTLVREQKDLYPLAKLRDLADLLPSASTHKQLQAVQSRNAAVRYWGAMGLLASKADDERSRRTLRRMVFIERSQAVRIAVAEALVQLDDERKHAALEQLKISLIDKQPMVSLRAANAIDHLDRKASFLKTTIELYLLGRKQGEYTSDKLGDKYAEWILRRTLKRWE